MSGDVTANFYQILGVSFTSTEEEIRNAYKLLALKHHPDKVGGNGEKFKEILTAYKTLSDSSKRKFYDQTWKQKFGNKSNTNGYSKTRSSYTSSSNSRWNSNYDNDPFESAYGFSYSSTFGSSFGNSGRQYEFPRSKPKSAYSSTNRNARSENSPSGRKNKENNSKSTRPPPKTNTPKPKYNTKPETSYSNTAPKTNSSTKPSYSPKSKYEKYFSSDRPSPADVRHPEKESAFQSTADNWNYSRTSYAFKATGPEDVKSRSTDDKDSSRDRKPSKAEDAKSSDKKNHEPSKEDAETRKPPVNEPPVSSKPTDNSSSTSTPSASKRKTTKSSTSRKEGSTPSGRIFAVPVSKTAKFGTFKTAASFSDPFRETETEKGTDSGGDNSGETGIPNPDSRSTFTTNNHAKPNDNQQQTGSTSAHSTAYSTADSGKTHESKTTTDFSAGTPEAEAAFGFGFKFQQTEIDEEVTDDTKVPNRRRSKQGFTRLRDKKVNPFYRTGSTPTTSPWNSSKSQPHTPGFSTPPSFKSATPDNMPRFTSKIDTPEATKPQAGNSGTQTFTKDSPLDEFEFHFETPGKSSFKPDEKVDINTTFGNKNPHGFSFTDDSSSGNPGTTRQSKPFDFESIFNVPPFAKNVETKNSFGTDTSPSAQKTSANPQDYSKAFGGLNNSVKSDGEPVTSSFPSGSSQPEGEKKGDNSTQKNDFFEAFKSFPTSFDTSSYMKFDVNNVKATVKEFMNQSRQLAITDLIPEEMANMVSLQPPALPQSPSFVNEYSMSVYLKTVETYVNQWNCYNTTVLTYLQKRQMITESKLPQCFESKHNLEIFTQAQEVDQLISSLWTQSTVIHNNFMKLFTTFFARERLGNS